MAMPEVIVQPRVSRVKPEHPVALQAAEELRADLRDLPGVTVEERDTPVDGTKGAVSDLVLALGGPAVVAGLVTALRLWLQRDARDRAIIVRRAPAEGGGGEEVEIHGTNVSDQTIREAMKRVLGPEV